MNQNKKTDFTKMDISQIIDDVKSGKASLVDILTSAQSGDYWSHVQAFRLSYIIMQDPEALVAMRTDLNERIKNAKQSGISIDEDWIEKGLKQKDGQRRFSKLTKQRADTFNSMSSLLSGTDFESCLKQYKELIAYVENLWGSACQEYKSKKFPLCAFISILVIEEIGKLSNLYNDLLFYDAPRNKASAVIIDRDHRRKHFIGVVSGALINARLDRVLGRAVVKKILHEAESDEFEKIRQSCLYIDVKDGNPVTPDQIINEEKAKMLVILAGELMAEVLGHFPWEFERMINNVITFEREIGIPEKKIELR